MSDIFISYSSEDKGRVQALARALERKGWSVWWDRRIPAGKSFDDVIHEALKAARSVVVVWTKISVKSTWVKNESRSGLRRNILFPVMLLDEVEIPLEFEHLQAAHLMDWQPDQEHPGFDQFIGDLAGVIGVPVTQSQATPALSAKPTPEPETGLLQGAVRAVLISGNNNLSALTLSPGTLTPAVAASITDYTVTVASDVTSVTISASKADLNAILSGCVTVGSGTATGQATIPLNGPGIATSASITVTAPNGSSKTYRITVKRAAPSGNNNLSALTLSSGTLGSAFNANTLSYTMDVASTVTSVSVTPTRQDSNATITVNGQPTNSGQARTIALSGPGSNTLINIVVTAPNGAEKTYAVEVSRAAEVEPEPERLELRASATMAGTVNSDSPRESFMPQAATEFSEVSQESAHVNEDRANQPTSPAPSTQSFPIFPIGLSLIAVIGALVYFLLFSQGSPPVTRDVASYQPPVQSPSPRTEVTTPPPAPESIKQPSVAPTKTKSPVKREVTSDETLATKPRPVAGAVNTITGKDGAPMVLIPAVNFWMGSLDSEGDKAEHPRHQIYLDAFYMDKFEVTVERYADFMRAKNRSKPNYWDQMDSSKHRNLPVVGVDWYDANAHCEWVGKRLPTEAEWEKAARGTDGRTYPWGNERPAARLANFRKGFTVNVYDERLAPVDSYEAGNSPYGFHHMAGNVWEWTADWYDENYYGKSPERNPKGPSSGQYWVLRGGSWGFGPSVVRSADRRRVSPENQDDGLGFRCAQDVPN